MIYAHDAARGRIIVATVSSQEANDPRLHAAMNDLLRSLRAAR